MKHILFLFTLTLISLSQAEKPNIVFIFTDDQDYQLNSLDYMPNVQKHLVEKGTTFRNHYATVSLCCPSRVSLLRGQYAHNTNITDVSPPYGGYNRFNSLKLGEDYLPIWLQKAGYHTNYIGKLMNQYSVNNYNHPIPKGFDYQDQLVDPYTYIYHTAVFSKDGQDPVYYPNQYQTDVIHAKAKAALKRLENATDPFFLWVAPMAPHAQFTIHDNGSLSTGPAVPAARHAHLFQDVKIPRHPHFNPKRQSKTASFWKHLDRLSPEEVDGLDEAYRNRLRALQAVDEMVGSLMEELERQGRLENTFVVYSADNGYHLGQHRSFPGKTSNLEEDINVPLIVRGPGVPEGKKSDRVSAHHDLAPTFLALAGAPIPRWVDGGVMPLTNALARHPQPVSKESFAVEYWTPHALDEIFTRPQPVPGPNIYKTIRVIAEEYDYMYAVWCTGEHELYDLKTDPFEMNNLYASSDTKLISRLDALLVVLKSCRAHTCRDPWRTLHPGDARVQTLKDALKDEYDGHYAQLKPMRFEACLPYYDPLNELPHHFMTHQTCSGPDRRSQVVLQKKSSLPGTYHALFKLVPASPSTVGDKVPEEDALEPVAVRRELIQTPVDWSKYGFYGFGN
ncbi:hypothetical protein G6F16_004238 [Rhizopus arrhizus]|nr:hypothetical protein G6F17_004062 [Rhizopus arrhizus]KAG0873771.1 hypothetical protein G6F16_004238 [Rhizopus arrhizus]KAG0967624.1 hypothetical protein G6F31_003615 [Rhizopus arrhizus]